MSELGDIRDSGHGYFETLVSIEERTRSEQELNPPWPTGETLDPIEHTERWEPLATTYLRYRLMSYDLLPDLHQTFYEALRSEGWIAPDDELLICGESHIFPSLERVVCLLRAGHVGDHRERGFSWTNKEER